MVSISSVAAETVVAASNGSSNDTTKAASSMVSPTIFYEKNPEQLKVFCDFLRSRNGPAVREALLMEKRVHYLKGALFICILFINFCRQ